MSLEELTVGEDLMYQEYPVKILDSKVQWSNHTEEEDTWEKEDQLKAKFLDIFFNLSESQGQDSS
jgi:hypothetical protein